MPKPYNPQDKYFKKAKDLGYRARSIFKLEEIQNKFKILKPNLDVLDLGAAPGSWLQYAGKIVGPQAQLIGLDQTPIEPIAKNIKTLALDIFSPEAEAAIKEIHPARFPVILSDLAPATSGIKETDHCRSLELNRQVLLLANKFLTPKGIVVFKVFQGADFNNFLAELKSHFRQVTILKPQASRDRSFEVYVIAKR
jgi:23S rRNA (uridine2552-2'-O)-methyltransferase